MKKVLQGTPGHELDDIFIYYRSSCFSMIGDLVTEMVE